MKKKNKEVQEGFGSEFVKSIDESGLPHSVDDNPAIVVPGQGKFWHKNGLLHRDNNKPAVEFDTGEIEFWLNGQRIKRLERQEAMFHHWKE